MAELTLDVPDELIQRLQPLQNCLPTFLTLLVEAISVQAEGTSLSEAPGTETPLAYTEVLDFLLTRPTPPCTGLMNAGPCTFEYIGPPCGNMTT